MIKVITLWHYSLDKLEEKINLFLEEVPEEDVRDVRIQECVSGVHYYAVIIYREDDPDA